MSGDRARQVRARLLADLRPAVADLAGFVAIPGVSADPSCSAELRRSAQWVAGRLRQAGVAEIRLVAPPGDVGGPVVVGVHGHAPDRPTLLVYGHHDVQPAGPRAGWPGDPFRLSCRDGVMIGRGVSDDKGQLVAWLDAIAAWLAVGGLPVNVRILVDGAEEVGSPGLPDLLRRHRRLLRCDVAVVSDTLRAPDGRPALVHSQRGALAVRVRVHRPGGTPHAGRSGGAVPDAAAGLARVVAGLAADPTWLRRGAPRALPAPASAYERTTRQPALTVVRLRSGSGAAAVPAGATADLDVRIVHPQRPAEVAAGLRARAYALAPPGLDVDVDVRSAVGPSVSARRSPAMSAAATALREGFGARPVLLRSGGTLPVVNQLRDVLGVETVVMGFGDPDDHAHATGERMRVDTFARGRLAAAAFLPALAAVCRGVG